LDLEFFRKVSQEGNRRGIYRSASFGLRISQQISQEGNRREVLDLGYSGNFPKRVTGGEVLDFCESSKKKKKKSKKSSILGGIFPVFFLLLRACLLRSVTVMRTKKKDHLISDLGATSTKL